VLLCSVCTAVDFKVLNVARLSASQGGGTGLVNCDKLCVSVCESIFCCNWHYVGFWAFTILLDVVKGATSSCKPINVADTMFKPWGMPLLLQPESACVGSYVCADFPSFKSMDVSLRNASCSPMSWHSSASFSIATSQSDKHNKHGRRQRGGSGYPVPQSLPLQLSPPLSQNVRFSKCILSLTFLYNKLKPIFLTC